MVRGCLEFVGMFTVADPLESDMFAAQEDTMALRSASSISLVVLSLVGLYGCGGETHSKDTESACKPDATEDCLCSGEVAGSRVCRHDGLGFTDCICPPSDASSTDVNGDGSDSDHDTGPDQSTDSGLDSDAVMQCTGGLTMCGEAGCVDLQSDSANCGGCSVACRPELELCGYGRCVAALVDIPHSEATFAIDATEVTRAQYTTWLAEDPPVDGQSAECAGNATFVPDDMCMNDPDACTTDCDNHPQICVDWCDAQAYCNAVGKRLCGHIEGGPVETSSAADSLADQWYYVCTQGVGASYPYFGGYHEDYCNGLGLGVGTTVPVASLTTCQASHPLAEFKGVYDLSGNVAEWEDSCGLSSNTEVCLLRGGAFDAWEEYLSCQPSYSADRFHAGPRVGFRCCSL